MWQSGSINSKEGAEKIRVATEELSLFAAQLN